MNQKRIVAVCLILSTVILLTGPAFALSESEVRTAVANSSREQVSGNIFIWFLCAVAFLKVSQKLDSFLASLGINVGRTGGSMLSELMIAGRALAGGMGAAGHGIASFFGHGGKSAGGGSGSGGTQPAGAPFSSGGGGLVGKAHRVVGNAAADSVTGSGHGLGSAVGGAMFDRSLERGGRFGTDVIRAVATGSIASVGTMKGAKASQALSSYLGYGPSAAQGTVGGNRASPELQADAAAFGSDEPVTLLGGSAAERAGDIPFAPPQASILSEAGEDAISMEGGSAGRVPITSSPGPAAAAGATPTTQPMTQPPIAAQLPVFSHVEIGGGRITGYETPAEGGEAKQFAMYNASQYMTPAGDYEVVKTVDGESWYKQYAVPTVQKTPEKVTEKGVVYDQKIVQQLPQIPKRKDKV